MGVILACPMCDGPQITLSEYNYLLMGQEGKEMVFVETWSCLDCKKAFKTVDGELV